MEKNHVVLGIMAHADAGKTTLTEAVLYQTGAIRSFGRVDHQNCFLDDDEMERSRGITIFSKQAHFEIKDTLKGGMHSCTLVDTPGHMDFTPEMERAMSVLDAAVLVVSGTDGVQGHTENIWRLLAHYQIPVLLFVNKMDRETEGREALLKQLKKRLSDNVTDFDMAMEDGETFSEEFLEEASVCEEELMEHFLEEDYSDGEWKEALAEAFSQRKIFPCFMGSALHQEGISQLLSGMSWLLPHKWGCREDKPFAGRVYKILHDTQGERLTLLKVTGGTLKVKDMTVYGEKRVSEKVNQLRLYHGGKSQAITEAVPGMICAVSGLTESWPGDGLGADTGRCVYDTEPVLTAAALVPAGCDEKKLLALFRMIEEEEPALKVYWDPQLKEIQVHIMGPIQLEILKYQFQMRFGIALEFGPCKILYKETLSQPVIGCGHYEPLRHYAEAHLLMEPIEAGKGVEVRSVCHVDALDINYQRLIMTHVLEREHRGVLTGSPFTDVRVTLIAGRAHLKHTEGGDFREAVYRGIRHGQMMAREKSAMVLLEPWYDFTITVPSEDIGRAMSDIQQRNGSFEPFELEGDMAVLRGSGPAVCFMDYAVEIASYTSGRGSIQLHMSGYRPCHNPEEVIAQKDYHPENDLANPAGSVFCSHGAGFVVPWPEAAQAMHCKYDFTC